MIQRNKTICSIVVIWFFSLFSSAHAISLPTVESVLQKGFSNDTKALANTTDKLLSEYQNTQNISALIFYAYGLLRQANHYKSINDYVNASEYAKLGFFFLDEAVDLNENDFRIHYLRARIDAYLPAELGRCVITLHDTDFLLKQQLSHDLQAHINYMRYRALFSCNQVKQAQMLLAQLDSTDAEQAKLLALDIDATPEWNVSEMTEVIMPLVKGE